MFLIIKKSKIFALLGLLLLVSGFSWIYQYGASIQAVSTQEIAADKGTVLIIDPGHGGEDGGAVAADGTVESDINLSIAKKLESQAKLMGWKTLMTRREDISIYDDNCKTLREKKVSDLKNRVKLCNETDNGVLISIHQNSLPDAKNVRGAQVFYNQFFGSKELAEAIQLRLNTFINGDHPKTAKPIGSNVYLLSHAQCPSVIVECGFLSNGEDLLQLTDEYYQKKISAVIFAAAIDHLS